MQQELRIPQPELRVLISGALPPPMGGVGTYYQTLLNSTLADRVDLHFVQTSSQKRELSSTGKATLSNIIAAIMDCWRFTRACLMNHPQIVDIGIAPGLSFIKHSFCVFIARILGCRAILHPHCSLLVLYEERSKLWQWFFSQVIRLTNGIVGLSNEWLQLQSIVPGSHVFYLPNAINLKLYSCVAEKHLTDVDINGYCKVLYLGWIGKAKGSFDLLDAASEAHSQGVEIKFDIVGDELAVGELELFHEKIRSSMMGDYVRLHPFAFGVEKLKFLLDADIFIHPSYREGMPMAVLEAMACGLPIVASRVGGVPDLIQNDVNGILVEPGKIEQLVDAICRLAKDPELRSSMGKANYLLACERYDIEKHVELLVDIYKKIINDPPTF